jgi:general secretion pathway protein J
MIAAFHNGAEMPTAATEPAARPTRGFTLVEAIVALAILSLIMLATVSALRTFANTQTSLDKLTLRIDEMRTVSSFLRDALDSTVFAGGAEKLSLGGRGGQEFAYFAGTSSTISWKAPVLFGEGYGGTFLLQLSHEEDELLLRWQEPLPTNERPEWAGTESRVLVGSLNEFQVKYLPDFGREWVDGWVSTDSSPALIKLSIQAGDRYWPDLIMQVQR